MSVPDKGLARPPKKIQNTKSSKIVQNHKNSIKTKKCQPVARDRPDLIQTESVPDKGLARQPKKINRTKKLKNKSKENVLQFLHGWLLPWLILTGDLNLKCTGRLLPTPPHNMMDDTLITLVDSPTVIGVTARTGHYYLLDGRLTLKWRSRPIMLSSKTRNKLVHSTNGNIGSSSQLNIIHWNAGSRLWSNKLLEIQVLVTEKNPDLCYITEANLWDYMTDAERHIPGYNLVLPKSMSLLNHARIVLLIKEGLQYKLLSEAMDLDTATIWCKIGNTKKNSLVIAGIYRQHLLLGDTATPATWLERQNQQEDRFEKVIRKWSNTSRNTNCIVIGDLNLDHLRWSNPPQHHEKMVNLLKDNIETSGFVQLVEGWTRTWQNQEDSLLDHIWSNCDARTVKVVNESRGASDHNLVGIQVSLKDLKLGGQNQIKRVWKDYDEKRCISKFRNTVWSDILLEADLDVVNTMIEDRICSIMDTEAPLKTVQTRTKYLNWLSDTTKTKMRLRDLAREKAKVTGDLEDWADFKARRNDCTSSQRKDRKNHYDSLYKKLESEKDPSKLFKTTKNILGWQMSGPPQGFLKDGRFTAKQAEIAEIQADYYEEKLVRIRKLLPRVNIDPIQTLRSAFLKWLPPGGKPTFKLKSVTIPEVAKMIGKLKNSHSYGQ